MLNGTTLHPASQCKMYRMFTRTNGVLTLDVESFNGSFRGELDLSQFNAAPGSHLSCHSFESQWAFPT
jgi:hypothetical protein